MSLGSLPAPVTRATEVELEAGTCVFSQGQPAENFVVVTEGCVTVFARSDDGKEVVLYRVRPGELCILTTACVIGHAPYPADAVTDARTKARIIPVAEFERFLDQSDEFRQFVFAGMGQRLAQVTKRFEHMVLDSVERRLATFLLNRSSANAVIAMTHEKLALEIGTAREVISRHLKSLEKENIVKLSRGEIEVVDPNTLAERA
jgi:CRP/FNR family transcriptional regulator